ncbi:hypothetical protein C0995_012820, partial [Termitomyces sp. Mi166
MTGYTSTSPNDDLWNVEMLIFGPGSTLIMRPSLPHAVFTPVPTICTGGHFYCTSTLVDTVIGIFHNFVSSAYLTNTSHFSASHDILMRILTYYLHELPLHEDDPDDLDD